MKLNWGSGIFIVLLVFILAVVGFFFYINNLDIHLVEDNYYEKELAFQERIDKLKNTALLEGEIKITMEEGRLYIRFPELDSTHQPAGTVLFYRPADQKKDISFPLQLSHEHLQAIDISQMDKGKWVLKLDWEMGGKAYYFEQGLVLAN